MQLVLSLIYIYLAFVRWPTWLFSYHGCHCDVTGRPRLLKKDSKWMYLAFSVLQILNNKKKCFLNSLNHHVLFSQLFLNSYLCLSLSALENPRRSLFLKINIFSSYSSHCKMASTLWPSLWLIVFRFFSTKRKELFQFQLVWCVCWQNNSPHELGSGPNKDSRALSFCCGHQRL